MAPEYDKLFDFYSEKRPDIVIARIEASIHEEISFEYRIFSFPMVVLFRPGDKKIGDLFQGQRVMDVMSAWIDKFAPAKELPKPNKIDETKIDTNLVIKVKSNSTEVTDEIEFLRREVHGLKIKIESLEEEIKIYKTGNTNTNVKKSNGDGITKDEADEKTEIAHEKRKPEINLPSFYYTVLGIAALLVLVALLLTLKRILFKSGSKQADNAHHKV